jgi:hypothetical protein
MVKRMNERILSPEVSPQDTVISLASIERLRPYLVGDNCSLVFFIGAGASAAGSTRMPTTPTLLQQVLLDALMRSGEFNIESSGLADLLKDASYHIGFEITLNDFWQICRGAITSLYASFAEFEQRCRPNRVHSFLAYWLSIGGVVLTTNYDCLIEREWLRIDQHISVRYQEEGPNSFENWREDLQRGGCLFKIHGSLDDPDSCLGALEHVGTRLVGHRADLLAEIVQQGPLCFLGWRGVDPDIPPLLSDLYKTRASSLPVFWIHYEGKPPGSISIQAAIDETSPLIREYASEHPILTDADRAFGEILHWVGKEVTANPSAAVVQLDFSDAVGQCSASGVTRFVGIALRRTGQLDVAEQVLGVALKLAPNAKERSAALQEISLLQQQRAGRKTDQSRELLEGARDALGEEADPWLQLNTDFGLLSMTIIALRSRPWLLMKVPGLFRKYGQDIEVLRRETTDRESVALHESLLHLYLGRLRFKLFGWLAIVVPPLADWILRPFNRSRSTIYGAKDIHLHSHIDVLAYRAVALARLRRCQNAIEDVPEIDRLISILNDDARAVHWENQRFEIERHCSDSAKPKGK